MVEPRYLVPGETVVWWVYADLSRQILSSQASRRLVILTAAIVTQAWKTH